MMVLAILSRYPFLLALAGSLVIELSAILVRRAAQTLGGWIWYLAGALSAMGLITQIWSLLWANNPDTLALAQGGPINLLIGPLLILGGVVWVIRAVLALGRQAFFPWPPTRLVTHSPYLVCRRPMTLGWAMLAAGWFFLMVMPKNYVRVAVIRALNKPLT